ncbi:hypothetical protein Tco_0756854 [Tanacetum coccineum]
MGRSNDTLRLLTHEQKAFRDNLRKLGVGYNGSCVLSQAYAKIPKLYRAYGLCDKNEQLHVFDSKETLEDAEKMRQIMRKISSWWNIDYSDVNSYEEWQVWLVSIRIQSKLKGVLEGVYYGLWWYMWNFRNKLLFDKKIPEKALIFDNLVSSSFY